MSKFRTHKDLTGCAPVPRYVVCAANRYGTAIISGARHYDSIMRTTIAAIGSGNFHKGLKVLHKGIESGRVEEQGFIDQYGEFMSREEACHVVLKNNQSLREKPPEGSALFSEDLY